MALIGGGALTLLINVVHTPALPHHVSFATTAASNIFLWRQGASALAAVLLLIGCVGLYLRQAERAGHFGVFAFTLVLVGTALALEVEWREVFDVYDFARRAPDALNALDAEKGLSLSNRGHYRHIHVHAGLDFASHCNVAHSRRQSPCCMDGDCRFPGDAFVASLHARSLGSGRRQRDSWPRTQD